MNIAGTNHRAIEPISSLQHVKILDQTKLPHTVEWRVLTSIHDVAEAISVMRVRGAPLIGASAAFGLFFGVRDNASDEGLQKAYDLLFATRPTAVNLRWGLDRVRLAIEALAPEQRATAAWLEACRVSDEDVAANEALGRNGLDLLRNLTRRTDRLEIMTHCNAGWLATVDWGTALAPIYKAHDSGVAIHVWVSETRPRGQGSALTCWELKEHGVPHTLIADNNAGHLLQRGLVDACIVGADRVSSRGDVANKIGTYMKALAAKAHDVPFFVAMPFSTIDWNVEDGIKDIPIEQRDAKEVTHLAGLPVAPVGTSARNDAFDVTPSTLVTAFITERGVFTPKELSTFCPW
ncbi:MAG: S-methyl-5-thioribose-1-phosphate isomerase [Verrucomicrobiaceae bacterium]|nr:S-methyl-5-thioribose-1-phosphate isomerase [Verrucomicrobiaceae bacterium]